MLYITEASPKKMFLTGRKDIPLLPKKSMSSSSSLIRKQTSQTDLPKFGDSICFSSKLVTPLYRRRDPTKKFIPVKLSKMTKHVLLHPTDITNVLSELIIIEEELTALYKQMSEFNDCDKASEVHRVLNSVVQKRKWVQNKNPFYKDGVSAIAKRQELQSIVNSYLKEWNEAFSLLMDTIRDRIVNIDNQQKQELDDFDFSIPTELLPKFDRKSPFYLELRERENKFAHNQMYKQAYKVKIEADMIEARENEQSMINMQNYYLRKRDKLSMKHKEQLDAFLEHADQVRRKMLYVRDMTLQGYIKRMRMIDESLDKMEYEGTINREDLRNVKISQQRVTKVLNADKSFPIPRCRAASSFIAARIKKD